MREQQQPVVLVSSCVGVHVALWSGGKVFETQCVLPALMCEIVVKVRSKDSERKCPMVGDSGEVGRKREREREVKLRAREKDEEIIWREVELFQVPTLICFLPQAQQYPRTDFSCGRRRCRR